jgi:glyoxylase-like metal-dependent hydrolase (beta-lactamase superfamily II)
MMTRCNSILRIPGVDTILPRPLVAGPDLRGDTSQSIGRDELWGVKEMAQPAVARTRPIEIAGSVWRVGGGFSGENEDANIFLVDGGGEMALIGAGSGLHTRAVLNRIIGLRKNPLDIKYILLPSSHWYEARGADSLRAATGARVCAHRFEAAALWRGDVLRTGLMIGDFSFAAFPPCRVDRTLEWGETIRVGRHRITVLDAPGFHRGSTAFLMTIDGVRFLAAGQAVLGDLPLPNDETTDGAIGWLDPHWGGNVPAWRQTIERFLELQPDVILPGQGPAQDEELERQLRECLARLEQIQTIQKETGMFPRNLFDTATPPARPDITPLRPKR